MNARRGGRGGHAVSVRADTALPQVWRRVKPGTFLGRTLTCSGVSQQQQQPICCVTQAHITRLTPGTIVTQRTSWHATPSELVSGAP
eukprot:scaffold49_cov70-Phaeocystis_antarctica.AAC.1